MVDQITLKLYSGNGGRGSTALWHGRRPYGGDGGDGGDVYIEGSVNMYDFSSLSQSSVYRAENGKDGLPLNKYGGKGKDIVLKVPLTTEVVIDGQVLFRIEKDGQKERILKGGRGSIGNLSVKKHPHWKMLTDEERQGESAEANLVLKLHSDIIFIGYPNAGKSSLLNKLTNAKAKVGAYEFTTLEPQTGRMDGITLMDLPGIIDDTHRGKGLGTHFTQHTEETKLVAHIVSLEHEIPKKIYEQLRKEIGLIDKNLAEKPEVIVLTKTDEATPEHLKKASNYFEKLRIPVISCTVLDDNSISQVKQFLKGELANIAQPPDEVATEFTD